MFDAFSLTDYLALMFGIYLVAAGIGLLQERDVYQSILDDYKDNAALGYLAGVAAFTIGLVMVRVHNEWGGNAAQCVVSLIGWVSLIEGILMLAFRRQFMTVIGCLKLTAPVMIGFSVFCFAVGAWLIFASLT